MTELKNAIAGDKIGPIFHNIFSKIALFHYLCLTGQTNDLLNTIDADRELYTTKIYFNFF